MTLLRPRHVKIFTSRLFPKSILKLFCKIGIFSFQTALSIETREEIVSLQNGLQTISLIKLEAIQIHLEDKFHFMRSGLVQVAVKPFYKKRA